MSNLLTVHHQGAIEVTSLSRLERLATQFLSQLKETTRRTYHQGARMFAKFLAEQPEMAGRVTGNDDRAVQDVARVFVECGQLTANEMIGAYKAYLLSNSIAPNSVNARLSAIAAVHKLTKILFGINWDIQVEKCQRETYADTRGCGLDGFIRVMKSITGDDARAARDRALITLMFDSAFRRNEVASLDMAHLDLEKGVVMIMGKGKTQLQPYQLPQLSLKLLRAWVAARGSHDGPLFVGLSNQNTDRTARLSTTSMYRIVQARGKAAGIEGLRPHKLRHAAITQALIQFNGNVMKVKDFSRHADVGTVQIYYDNLNSSFHEVGNALSASVEAAMAVA